MNSKQNPPKPPPPVVHWLVQNENGKTLGPLTTEDVLRQIAEGTIKGGEKIKRHPDGAWAVISKQPQFYDKLLDALEDVSKSKQRVSIERKKNEIQKINHDVLPSHQNVIQGEKQNLSSNSKEIFKKESSKPFQSVIELQDLKKIETKEKIKVSIWPLAFFLLATTFGAIAYFWPNKEVSLDKPRLIVPNFKNENLMNQDQIKQLMSQALGSFQLDTFEGYWDAQTKLVTLLEGAAQNTEARGLLCLVYKYLWPFVRQDSKDLEAVQLLSKTTKTMDPVGINGFYCESSQLMILGKYQEARGSIDQALNQPQLSAAPVLLMYKAEILASEKDYKTAILYSEKAVQLWPQWVKPSFETANYYSSTGQFQQSINNYEKVLQLNGRHRSALIEISSLLYFKLQKKDFAEKYQANAIASKAKITRAEEARLFLLSASLQAESKNFTKALEFAKKAYELNPADVRTRDLLLHLGGSTEISARSGQMNELVFLGDQYARAGDCLSAQAEYKAAFEIDKTNALAATKAAKCLWQLSQSQESIAWLNKAIHADKRLAIAYYMLADYYSQRFNYTMATQALNQGSAVLQNNFEILRGYGLVEFRRNNFKDAIGYLTRASKIFENDLDTVVLLAKSYLATGDFQKAQTYSVRAIEIDSTNADAQISYAKTLSQFKGIDSGIYYLKELINKYSYTIEYRLALAEIFKDAERFKQSEEIYRQIIEVDPRNKKAVIGLAASYQGQGLYERAIKLYFDAAVIDPSDAEPLFKAGLVYLESNKPAEAIQQFKRALKINPIYPRGNYYAGKAAFAAGNSSLALDFAATEKKNNPNLADPYILMAEVYSSLRDYQKCAAEYQQALRLRSQSADIYVRISKCYRLSGNLDVAENMLNIAASQESGFAEIYKEQGAIYEQKGDRRAAVQAYSKYLALSPNAPDRKEIENRISFLASGR